MSILRIRYQFLIVAFLLSQLQIWGASAGQHSANSLDELEVSAAKKFVDSCRQIREEKYGNVHFVMRERFESRRKTHLHYVTEIRFWARDNQYFRVDTIITESNHPQHKVGTRRRMVFTPEGSVSLRADSEPEPLTIREWDGDPQNNLANVLAFRWFRAAGRSGGIETDSCVSGLAHLELHDGGVKEYLKNCELIDLTLTNDGSRLNISWLEKGNPYSREFSIVCDVDYGVVLHTDTKAIDQDKSIKASNTETKEYDFDRFGCIPSSYLQTYNKIDGKTKYLYEIRFVDWAPVPLGVFSLEAQGLTSLQPQSVWGRRIWTLVIGALLFGIVYLVKRARSHASE